GISFFVDFRWPAKNGGEWHFGDGGFRWERTDGHCGVAMIYVDITEALVLFWLICILSTLEGALKDRLLPAGFCRQCGYDLTGNVSGVCPECGDKVAC